MKKKIFSVLFALVLVLSFSLVAAVPVAASPAILEVNGPVAKLTTDAGHYLGSFSPDGSKIVFTGAGSSIWVMNADGTGKTQVGSVSGSRPKWTPDGGISYSAGDDLKICNPVGANIVTVTTVSNWSRNGATTSGVHSHDWIEVDGTYKLAIASSTGCSTIYAADVNFASLPLSEGDFTRITDGATSAYSPAWSPDGTEIACAWGPGAGIVGVFVSDGSSTTPLRTIGTGGDYPDWGPNDKIAYHIQSTSELYVMDSDGSNDGKVFDGPAAMVAWSPDGKRIVYIDGFANKNIWTRSCPYGTIQDAINAANPAGGDTIIVAAGAYTENVLIDIDKRVTLAGVGSGNDPALNTVIQSAVSGSPVIRIRADGTSASERMTVKDLRVTGASGGSGNNNSGINVNNVTQGYLTFYNVAATDNTGNGIAFDIIAGLTDIKVVKCTLNNNGNAGLRIPTSTPGMSAVDITETTFNNNESGMTIYSNMTNLIITNCKFNDNVGVPGAWQGGYGIYLGHWSAANNMTTIVVENSEFARNRNSNFGTGICVEPENGGTYTGIRFNYNNFIDNENYGVVNNASTTVDATNNWWDDASGPTHTSNPSGTGDAIRMTSGDVVYSPWLGATLGTEPMTFVELVTGTDPPPVELQDEVGNPIATVDISGGDASQGTIAAYSELDDPEPDGTSLLVGTGKTGVLFLDVQVTGYASGMALITVPYPDVDPDDGIVDGTTIVETTLGLYYWDDDADMWLIAGNNTVDTDANTVSGYIPVAALTGTPLGSGGYPADEATVAIDSITNLTFSGNDTVALTIDTNTATLGAVTIDLTFDNTVVEVLGGENSDFDSLTVNPNYSVNGNMQTARFVANQLGATGVDATGKAVLAQVRLKAVGTTNSSSPLTLDVITLKDNDGISIPYVTPPTHGTATIGGLGDANSDGVVDVYDCVYIARAIAGIPGYSVTTDVGDVDNSGEVDAFDCTYLARHIAGIPGYEQLGG